MQFFDIVQRMLVFNKYLDRIIVKRKLTLTNATIHQYTICLFKNF